MKLTKKPTFEESLSIIDTEIAKRKYKWNLNSLAWLDFSDVSQIIRSHIFNKWEQYNPDKGTIQQWVNAVISSQIKNLLRNLHGNHARPCLKCESAKDNNGCEIYKIQCEKCPLYADWKKRKEPAYNIKFPLSIENHTNEIKQIFDDNSDISEQIVKVHIKMEEILKPMEYRVYKELFILQETEAVAAQKLGYISNEKGRNPGYKQIKNIRKIIVEKFKKAILDGSIDFY